MVAIEPEPSTILLVSTLIRDAVVALSAAAAAGFAYRGLSLWSLQLRGTTRYEAALKILRALTALQIAYRSGRQIPHSWLEALDRGSEYIIEDPETKEVKDESFALSNRTTRLEVSIRELEFALMDGRAQWGEAAERMLDPVLIEGRELLERVLSLRYWTVSEGAPDQDKEAAVKISREMIYGEKGDRSAQRFEAFFETAERWCWHKVDPPIQQRFKLLRRMLAWWKTTVVKGD